MVEWDPNPKEGLDMLGKWGKKESTSSERNCWEQLKVLQGGRGKVSAETGHKDHRAWG